MKVIYDGESNEYGLTEEMETCSTADELFEVKFRLNMMRNDN